MPAAADRRERKLTAVGCIAYAEIAGKRVTGNRGRRDGAAAGFALKRICQVFRQ